MQKQKVRKKWWIIENLLPGWIQICKILQNFLKLNLYSRKTENVQILFKGICEKIYSKFLCKNCTICFFLFKAFQRAIKNRNPMTESGSKYRFSRVCCPTQFILICTTDFYSSPVHFSEPFSELFAIYFNSIVFKFYNALASGTWLYTSLSLH